MTWPQPQVPEGLSFAKAYALYRLNRTSEALEALSGEDEATLYLRAQAVRAAAAAAPPTKRAAGSRPRGQEEAMSNLHGPVWCVCGGTVVPPAALQ